MKSRNRSYRYLKKSLWILALISCAIILTFTLLQIATHTHERVATTVLSLNSFEGAFRFIRWSILGALITFWDEISEVAGKYYGFEEDQLNRTKSMRWRVAALMIVFEVLVVEAVPAALIG